MLTRRATRRLSRMFSSAPAAPMPQRLNPREPRLEVGQPDVIGAAVSAVLDVMAAKVIAAIDQGVTDTGFTQFAEGCGGRRPGRQCETRWDARADFFPLPVGDVYPPIAQRTLDKRDFGSAHRLSIGACRRGGQYTTSQFGRI